MRILGNIMILPFKLIFLLGYGLSMVGMILASIFEVISNVVLGKIISLCIILVLASSILYGSKLTDNSALSAGLIFFSITVVVAIIPFLFKGLQSLFQKGLSFWF
jgi:hypothetical protein